MATCYDIAGNVVQGWKPCITTGSNVSHCCGGTDLCMDNGFCLNAGGNQAYTVQGCTSKTWEAPCNFPCDTSDPSDTHGQYYIDYCWNTDPSSATGGQWCCGHDCCGDGGAIFNNSLAHQVYSPGKALVAALVTATTTVTSTATPTIVLPTADYISRADHDAMIQKLGAGLGAGPGVGLPALFSLFALLFWYFHVRQWRSKAQDLDEMSSLHRHATYDDHGRVISQGQDKQVVTIVAQRPTIPTPDHQRPSFLHPASNQPAMYHHEGTPVPSASPEMLVRGYPELETISPYTVDSNSVYQLPASP
ncbi:uncharacterized protein B0I36DRAFT_349810 [Microdochium trichocladiopsis]|uniref:Uncharacterized protein n=1 Tax=Microdochium trichocladiopsis TaxID=1682393 RepID=A0A9P8Y3P0_9PEZI|nr:uncharacterized protein B0I36DRAFT_349810 [Microdochium trichocladiopsis]KAH7028819.1 hypothetical protein B0I36DRAFT_349810 [Microdochium trichocladiopsis]